MIGQYYEPFRKLKMIRTADGMGGEDVVLQDGAEFAAGLCRVSSTVVTAAEKRRTMMHGALLHPIDVALDCGDLIRRERDGAVFRVISDSDDTRTPSRATVFFAQTKVERLVDAHDNLYAAADAA